MTTPAYFNKFENIAMERTEDGVLTIRVHTNGGPFKFAAYAHAQFPDAFWEVSRDRDNRVVIFTGTGDVWCDSFDQNAKTAVGSDLNVVERWDIHFWEGKKILQNMLDIEVPVIGAVNGPAKIHSEYLLTCDILLASEKAEFQDWPHLNNAVSPSDGVHVLWPYVLGPTRGKYFLLTQQVLDAQKALEYGVVNEVLPHGKLMDRAHEIARTLLRQPQLTLRYARVALTQNIKKTVLNELSLGLAVEALTAADKQIRADAAAAKA